MYVCFDRGLFCDNYFDQYLKNLRRGLRIVWYLQDQRIFELGHKKLILLRYTDFYLLEFMRN